MYKWKKIICIFCNCKYSYTLSFIKSTLWQVLHMRQDVLTIFEGTSIALNFCINGKKNICIFCKCKYFIPCHLSHCYITVLDLIIKCLIYFVANVAHEARCVYHIQSTYTSVALHLDLFLHLVSQAVLHN